MKYVSLGFFVMIGTVLIGCTTPAPPPSPYQGPTTEAFGAYWYQGKAELTSYTLEQVRYGAVHPGHAVLIFVTEDHSRSKHVKLDDYRTGGDDAVKVMKLNFTKKFNTGIYPYSMMASVFTPVYRNKDPHTLRVTTTSQEWCGHTFTQIDLDEQQYHLRLHSYFESEGDQELRLDQVLLEDEIWNTIRLNPDDLPTGDLYLLPGTMYQRLSHDDWAITPATATLQDTPGQPDQQTYTLTYPELHRTLAITFNRAAPHEIERWEESTGNGPERLVTQATRLKRIQLDYWRHNSPEDTQWREALGLTP